MRVKKIHKNYISYENHLDDFINNFEIKGKHFGNQDRNSLKLFDLNGEVVNIKSFRTPNLINQLVYAFFRKSKAQRSFEYANKLTESGIGTPQPIAYYEFKNPLFKKSYYLSLQQECDFTYRELTTNFDTPNHENILRAFTKFTFDLHEKNIHFLDHSPGNTLIKKTARGYDFFLVDLNRMEFKTLDINARIKNFSRLTTHKSMVEIMSDEYAKLYQKDFKNVFNLMWSETQKFQEKYKRKKRLKRKLKFWKSYD